MKREGDLNRVLVNYVDMKYSDLWSDIFCREKKREMKTLSTYSYDVAKGLSVYG